jgi:thiamine transport system substrate-binding protein
MEQAHSFSPSWSTSYGLFTKKQTKLAFSYLTSPIYHEQEEKNSNYVALKFKEPHPIQFEFVGIPEICKNCELAEQFVNMMLSNQGQKIIMEKNYMFPVMKGVREKTPFDIGSDVNVIPGFNIPKQEEIESWYKKWTNLRRDIAN